MPKKYKRTRGNPPSISNKKRRLLEPESTKAQHLRLASSRKLPSKQKPTLAGKQDAQNLYQGWTPPHEQADRVVARCPVRDMQPERFWTEYVSQRRPVVLHGHLQDQSWRASEAWTDDHLIQAAGAEEVTVERRNDALDSFGKGRKERMLFRDFVRRAAAGDDSLYLTTQQVKDGCDGHPEVMAAPVEQLQADFPLVPELLGGLVPQQINIWMGCAPNGASSGLHHDFHDNLYILLRGRKRFHLWSPADAHRMATFGTLRKVHPNGRIVYQGQGNVGADGTDPSDVAAWEAKGRIWQKSAEPGRNRQHAGAAAAEGSGEEDGDEALLEDALKQAAARGRERDSDDSDDWPDDSLRDDYVDSDAASGEEGTPSTVQNDSKRDPPSFSRIDLGLPNERISAEHPGFPGKASALEWDMLYLPCGWFHEVTSFTTDDGGTHLALNYWLHPPDNLHPGGFTQPYVLDLWPSLWRKRRERVVQPGRSAS